MPNTVRFSTTVHDLQMNAINASLHFQICRHIGKANGTLGYLDQNGFRVLSGKMLDHNSHPPFDAYFSSQIDPMVMKQFAACHTAKPPSNVGILRNTSISDLDNDFGAMRIELDTSKVAQVLSHREYEVAQALVGGQSVDKISSRFSTAVVTVHKQIQAIHSKLGIIHGTELFSLFLK